MPFDRLLPLITERGLQRHGVLGHADSVIPKRCDEECRKPPPGRRLNRDGSCLW